MIIVFLLYSLILSYVLVAWFCSNPVVEYYKLFRLKCSKTINSYISEYDNNIFLGNLSSYLAEKRDGFFYRLISCPICLSGFLSILMSIVFFNPYLLGAPIISLILFYSAKLLIKHSL